MRIIDPFLAELDQEAKTTRKFLEELPADKLSYKPHEKSMEAGKLARHVATIPGALSEWVVQDTFDMSQDKPEHPNATKEDILREFDESLAKARKLLGGLDDAKMMGTWTFQMGGKTLMSMPRVAMVRSFIFNHLYHHRGQLGVYLRLMGAKVPASYGPSADDNPMAQMMEAAALKA